MRSSALPPEPRQTPRLRSDLRFRSSGPPNQSLQLLEDRVGGKCYELGPREAAGLLACDGERSCEEARLATGVSPSTPPLTTPEFQLLLAWAAAKQLLIDHSDPAINRMQATWETTRRAAWLRWTNPISLQLSLGSPERLLRRISPALQGLFDLRWIPVAAIVGLYALLCLWTHAGKFSQQVSALWNDGQWPILLAVWLAVKVGHELAHGVVSHRYRATVRDWGVLLILFLPLAYVDVSSSARLSNRWQRIHIAAAGMYFELVLAAVATVIWAWCDDRTVGAWMHAIVLSAGLSTLLFNANPLMKFDGYYILADLVRIPNLAHRGQQWLGRAFQAWCLGVPTATLPLPWGQRMLVAGYGVAALVWRILLQITLTIAAAALFHGLGILLALLAGLHYLIAPACRLVHSLQHDAMWREWRPTHVAVTLGVAGLCGWLLTAVCTGPAYLSVPAVVRHPAERYVRAGAAGFVSHVAVADGQFVRAGDLLVQLHRSELDLWVASLEIQVEQARHQAGLARRENNWVEYDNAVRRMAGLELQLAERQAEREGLTLRAPVDGIVRQPGLSHFSGQYFAKGAAVLTLDDGLKELVVAISQDDLATLPESTGIEMKLIFPGLPLANGRLGSLGPAASVQAPAAALTQAFGGPLSVQPAGHKRPEPKLIFPASAATELTADVQLITPHVSGYVEIPPAIAEQLPVGATGTAWIPRRRQSLASYLVLQTRRWFARHLEHVRPS